MSRTDNLKNKNGQREDAVYDEIISQPRMRVVEIATGGSQIDVGTPVAEVLTFTVKDANHDNVAVGTHGLSAPVPNGTDDEKIDFTGTAAADYAVIVWFK